MFRISHSIIVSSHSVYPFVRNAFLVLFLPDLQYVCLLYALEGVLHVTTYVCNVMKTESTTCKQHMLHLPINYSELSCILIFFIHKRQHSAFILM